VPLFRWFIVRRLVQEPLRTLLTTLGIALGIGVVLAVRMANQSAIDGFRSALDTVAGRTSLEIAGSGRGVDEMRLPDLAWLSEWGAVSPVIEGDAAALVGPGRQEEVHVLGVDILQEQPFREYALRTSSGRQPAADEFLRLLSDPAAAVVPEAFATRHGLGIGSRLDVVFGDAVRPLIVRGVLADDGPARVLDGNFVLMDIAAAQWAFDRLGRVDRIDVRLKDPSRLEEAEAAIGARLPAGLVVQRPARRGAQVERMLASFQFNLAALSLVALLVGVFLVYNTVAASVVSRRSEIGMLRAVGAGRATLLAFFIGEALALGTAGCALGTIFGWVMATGAVHLTASTVSTLYVTDAVRVPGLSIADIARAFVLGMPLSALAALAPAVEAFHVSPLDAIASTAQSAGWRRPHPRAVVAAAALFAAAAIATRQQPVRDLPVFGFIAGILAVLGVACLSPLLLFVLGRLLPRRWPVLAVEGRLAGAQLAASIPRVSVPVAALATSIAMLVAIAVMVSSFRQTVIYWVGQTLQADLFVATGRRATLDVQPTVSEALERAIVADPDVDLVDRASSVNVPYEGRLVVVGADDWTVLLSKGRLVFKTPANAADKMRNAVGGDALGRDAVVVSEALSLRFGVTTGSDLRLPTPSGPRTFRVIAVYFDYSTDRGVVLMDRRTFTRAYGETRPTALSVYLKSGRDPQAVRDRLLESLGSAHHVFIHTNASLRAEVLRIFDRTFAITYGLEAIAILVSLLGMAGTMITLVIERRRDLGLLRLVGADARQIRRTVMIESGLLGAASQALGIPLGFALSLLLIDVINVQSFGWTIQWHVPFLFLAQASAALLLASVLAGLYPARAASSTTLSDV
jgi:putative ABC transport system permease protein